MTHPRKSTRDAVKERLAGLTLNGVELNGFVNRTQDLDASHLPAAAVLTPEETSEREGKSAALDRRLAVLIVIAIEASKADDVDDELDGWAELVEDRLKQMPIGPARRLTLNATSLDLPAVEEGETWVGYLAMEYEAQIPAE